MLVWWVAGLRFVFFLKRKRLRLRFFAKRKRLRLRLRFFAKRKRTLLRFFPDRVSVPNQRMTFKIRSTVYVFMEAYACTFEMFNET